MRTVTLVGAIKAGQTRVAVLCAWCGRFKSPEDAARHAAGAPSSHGICQPCSEEWFSDPCWRCDDAVPTHTALFDHHFHTPGSPGIDAPVRRAVCASCAEHGDDPRAIR